MRIKKIAPVTPANGNIKNSYGTSQTDTYSQEYINNATTPKINLDTSATPLSNYFSTVDVNRVVVTGKIAQFTFRGLVANAIPGNTDCISGLPVPYIGGSNVCIFNISDDRYPTTLTPYWGFIYGNGKFKSSGIEAGKWVHIFITYIIQ